MVSVLGGLSHERLIVEIEEAERGRSAEGARRE